MYRLYFHPVIATVLPLCFLRECVNFTPLVFDCDEETTEVESKTDLGHPRGWVELVEDTRIFRAVG